MSRNHGRRVHLVGSIPLGSSREVFRAVSRTLGPLAKRIPDGETGDRANWISFQVGVLATTPNVVQVASIDLHGFHCPIFGLKDSTKPVTFRKLRYADEAKASYKEFAALKKAGKIAADVRFQVCLPTPFAVVTTFIAPAFRGHIAPAYEARMHAEVNEIVASIPQTELAIQWDVAAEVVLIAGREPESSAREDKNWMLGELVDLGNVVPSSVELGFHFCYYPGHEHLVEPGDLALYVEIANLLAANVWRPINWFHMPVPRDRSDDAYFEPLHNLRLEHITEVFLGLIHLIDGEEGTQKRIATARKFISNFGIGTECGFGCGALRTVNELLDLHKTIATA